MNESPMVITRDVVLMPVEERPDNLNAIMKMVLGEPKVDGDSLTYRPMCDPNHVGMFPCNDLGVDFEVTYVKDGRSTLNLTGPIGVLHDIISQGATDEN